MTFDFAIEAAAAWTEHGENAVEKRLTGNVLLIEEVGVRARRGIDDDAGNDLCARGDEVLKVFVVQDNETFLEFVFPERIVEELDEFGGDFFMSVGVVLCIECVFFQYYTVFAREVQLQNVGRSRPCPFRLPGYQMTHRRLACNGEGWRGR